MKFGVATFFTGQGIGPTALAQALEERGFDSLFVTEHTHIPASRRTPYPLARAILAAVDDVTPAENVEAVTGAGLTGHLDGTTVRLGRPGWIDAGDLSPEVERMQHAGGTAVLNERGGVVIGAVAVRDELRPEAFEVVAGLRRDGYRVAHRRQRAHRPRPSRRRRYRRRTR
jgi:hypothetical protein